MRFNYEDPYQSGSSPYQRNPIYGSQKGLEAFGNERRAEEANEGKNLGQTVATITKIGLVFVEILGAGNTIAKLLSRQKISKNDILWASIPGSFASTIHVLQKLGSTNSAPSSTPPQSQNHETQRQIVQGILAKQPRVQSAQTKLQALEQSFVKQSVPKENPQDERLKEKENQEFDWEKWREALANLLLPEKVKIEENPNALRWLNMMSKRPRILILGEPNSGKSAQAYYLLEILHPRGPCYVYRLPEEGRNLIPIWLGVIDDLIKAPSGSTVLVDEAYLSFSARDSQTKRSKELTKVVNLARQRDLSLIFVAHEARHIDLNVLSGIDTLIMKKPGPLQPGLDRPILRPYTTKAKEFFQTSTDGARQRFSYICFSPSGFEGGLENPKPSFWSEKLSKVFALGAPSDDEKSAVQLSKEEKKKKAKNFRQYGWSFQEIADALGVGKATVYRWLNEDDDKSG